MSVIWRPYQYLLFRIFFFLMMPLLTYQRTLKILSRALQQIHMLFYTYTKRQNVTTSGQKMTQKKPLKHDLSKPHNFFCKCGHQFDMLTLFCVNFVKTTMSSIRSHLLRPREESIHCPF